MKPIDDIAETTFPDLLAGEGDDLMYRPAVLAKRIRQGCPVNMDEVASHLVHMDWLMRQGIANGPRNVMLDKMRKRMAELEALEREAQRLAERDNQGGVPGSRY